MRPWLTRSLLLLAVVSSPSGCKPKDKGGTQPSISITCDGKRALTLGVGEAVECRVELQNLPAAAYADPFGVPRAFAFSVAGGLVPNGSVSIKSWGRTPKEFGSGALSGCEGVGGTPGPLAQCARRCCGDAWKTGSCESLRSNWVCRATELRCCQEATSFAPPGSRAVGHWQIRPNALCTTSYRLPVLSRCACVGDKPEPNWASKNYSELVKGERVRPQADCWPEAEPWVDSSDPYGWCDTSGNLSVVRRIPCAEGGGKFLGDTTQNGESLVCCVRSSGEPEVIRVPASSASVFNASARIVLTAAFAGTATVRLEQLRTTIPFIETEPGSSTVTLTIVGPADAGPPDAGRRDVAPRDLTQDRADRGPIVDSARDFDGSKPDVSADGSTKQDAPSLDLALSDGGAPGLLPIADAYLVAAQYATNNYGSSTVLVVKTRGLNEFTRKSYLAFDLASFQGSVASATLRLTASGHNGAAATQQLALYGITDNNDWNIAALPENAINWNNAPKNNTSSAYRFLGQGPAASDAARLLATKTISTADAPGTVYTFDVTEYVRWALGQNAGYSSLATSDADKKITFMLSTSLDTTLNIGFTFSSRQAASGAPRLVVSK